MSQVLSRSVAPDILQVRENARAVPTCTVRSELAPYLPRDSTSGSLSVVPNIPDASDAQRILTEGARQFLNFGRVDLAEVLCEQALSENHCCPDTQTVMGSILDRRGDWQRSLARLRRAYELAPQAPQVRLNLALALLRFGNYQEGLGLYEARIDKPTWAGFATPESRAVARHLLLRPGEPVEARRILVLAEQGLGDCIMFARYIPMLAKRGARIALACNPSLRSFFNRVSGIETSLSPPADQPLAQINLAALPFDAWVPLLSLALWFGTEAKSVPAKIPYWTPDQTRVAAWQSRLAGIGRPGVPKVGLVFQANHAGANYAAKSMTVSDLRPLLALDQIDLVNLQHGPVGRELATVAPGIIDPLRDEVPLDEYGAAVAASDLLISVDTMAAHCAGAMGHAAWVAVPHSPHWAWGLDQTTTPWYPSTRIFRQAKPGDWSGTIAMLARHLEEAFAPSGRPARAPASGAQKQEIRQNPAHGSVQLDRGEQKKAAQGLARIARALIARGRLDLADTIAELALRTDQTCDRSHDVMGDLLDQAGHWDAALEHHHKAAASGADRLRFKLATAQLLRGELEQGFANHEARLTLPIWVQQALPVPGSLAAVQQRRLRPGDPIRGRHIAVFTEQGLGDTFFGARFLRVLAERGADITLVCRSPMRPFFARLPFLREILSPPGDKPHAKIDLRQLKCDAVCPLLSLPHALRITQASAAPQATYLVADVAQVAAWRARYEREGRPSRPKVGLVWQANPSNRALSERSMRAQDLAPLGLLDDVDLVNLQHGPAGRDLPRVVPGAIDVMREPLSLDAFAAALAATDLIVTVDTMAAHCAGAFGLPVWVALPNVPAWYWGLSGADCGWYPTARLFRSGRSGWPSVTQAIISELKRDCVPNISSRCSAPRPN
jgi:ADP-heptose:LPS heptosyltransferase/Tfp pilus assembly protein PilF